MSAEGYGDLVELAERELELVRREEYEGLPEIWQRRDSLVASLPEFAPAEARSALERAAALQSRSTALLEERRAQTGAELRHLARGRAAMRGYTPQIRRVPLVDHAG